MPVTTTTLDPLEQLLAEHRAFRETCATLSDLLAHLEARGRGATIGKAEYAVLLRVRHEIREHLNVHLIKEEEIFFPRLEKLVPQGRVKFLFLNYDHEYLKLYFDDFVKALTDLETDRIPMHRVIAKIIETGRLIITNLLQHILAEDNVYFELAQRGLSPSELAAIGEEMNQLEQRLRA